MHEGKITRQYTECCCVLQKARRKSATSGVHTLPGPPRQPRQPRQQAHLSARPEPGSLRRRLEQRHAAQQPRKKGAGPKTGAALPPRPPERKRRRTPPPQGNNSCGECAGLGMILTGYRSLFQEGGTSCSVLLPVAVTSGPARAREAGPGAVGVGSEWDRVTPQSGLGFINVSVPLSLQFFVIFNELCFFHESKFLHISR